MSVMRWDPFRDLLSIQDEMNQLFRRSFQGETERGESRPQWAPALDILERDDAYVVNLEVPGVKQEDLEITLDEGLLTVKGERTFSEQTGKDQYHRVERRYGSFRRSITLPSQTKPEAVEASFEDGVLQIVVPKAEESKPRRVEIRPGRGAAAVEGKSASA